MRLFGSIITFSPIVVLTIMPSLAECQELVINKHDVDKIFGLNLAEWNAQAKQFQHPLGWEVRISPPLDTGIIAAAFDPKSGMGLSLQPLIRDGKSPPDMLIVSNLFPPGMFRFSDQMKGEMEAATKADLGPAYSVHISFGRTPSPAPGFDNIDIIITQTRR